jgi:hypothetical protein
VHDIKAEQTGLMWGRLAAQQPACIDGGAGNFARSRLLGGSFEAWRVFLPGASRLKAGCSQNWLPHSFGKYHLVQKYLALAGSLRGGWLPPSSLLNAAVGR